MDVDTFDADYKISGKGKEKLYEVEFEALSQGDVVKMMQVDVENISGIFGVDVSTAAPLVISWTAIHCFFCEPVEHRGTPLETF